MYLLPLEFTVYCLPLSTILEAPREEGVMGFFPVFPARGMSTSMLSMVNKHFLNELDQ